MTRGKRTCKILKEIRQQIADNNNIEYITSECHFQGECKGTCPKCESEVRYLENEINKRRQLGKAVAIAGISLGVVGSFSACHDSIFFKKNVKNLEEIADAIPNDSFSVIVDWMSLNATGMIFEPWDDTTVINNDEYIWRHVDIYPEYIGGNESLAKFIHENTIYPQEAKEKKWEGGIYMKFIVEQDGSITNVEIESKSEYPIFDEEAIRVVKSMPKWKPGKLKGKIVRTQMRMPINFVLEK